MCPHTKKKINLVEFEKFRLPIYSRKAKDKVVYFYVIDPQSVIDGEPRLVRIRKKFNHIQSAKQRDEAALRFRDEISIKLKEGWNPLMENCGNKSFVPFNDVLDKFRRHIDKLKKDEVFTKKTHYDYCNRIENLRSFNEKSKDHHITYIYELNTAFVEAFLDHVYVDKDTSPRTRNNYLTWVGTFCAFCRKCGYISTHPTEDIKPLKEKDKLRKAISKSDMKRLLGYLQQHKPYLLACMFQYYTFVRPNELVSLRVGDINIKNQTLFVSHTISKNRKDGVVTIPKKVIKLMLELGILSAPSDYYLFGKDFLPSPEKANNGIFRNHWLKVRKALHFPSSYKFYSLKDTGISDTIDEAGLTIAKDQARHSSVQVTNEYCRKDQLTAHPELFNFDGAL